MPKPAPKPIIAVDIDEVLARFADAFIEFCNARWETNLKPDDYTEHWSELWRLDDVETDQRSKYLYETDVFRNPKRIDEAENVLRKLANNYDLVILTSRHRAITRDTTDWVKEHFGGLFKEIHFAGIWDDIEKSIDERFQATKAEVAKQISADYLIDDNPKHCFAAAEAGITSILFGDYKWNRDTKLTANMVRAKNWQEVLEYFDER